MLSPRGLGIGFIDIHKILAHTIIARYSGGDKCNRIDIFCLYCMIERREANLATVLLSSFQRGVKPGRDTRLTLGPYIGRLAASLGVFDQYPRAQLIEDPPTIGYRIRDMCQARMVEARDPERWLAVGDVPEVRQRVRLPHVQAPPPPVRGRRHARPDYTLAQVIERQDRFDAALRFIIV